MHTVLHISDFAVIFVIALGVLIVTAGMLGVLARGSGVNLKSRERARLLRLEEKLDLLVQHAGITYDNSTEALKYSGVRAALESGDKIKAIMAYRQATDVGLPDAKAVVENLLARRQPTSRLAP